MILLSKRIQIIIEQAQYISQNIQLIKRTDAVKLKAPRYILVSCK